MNFCFWRQHYFLNKTLFTVHGLSTCMFVVHEAFWCIVLSSRSSSVLWSLQAMFKRRRSWSLRAPITALRAPVTAWLIEPLFCSPSLASLFFFHLNLTKSALELNVKFTGSREEMRNNLCHSGEWKQKHDYSLPRVVIALFHVKMKTQLENDSLI